MLPARVFKFIPNDPAYIVNTLSTPYLWFASTRSFNDPFETEGSYEYPPFNIGDFKRYQLLAMMHDVFVSRGNTDWLKPFPRHLTPRSLYDTLCRNFMKLQEGLLEDVYVRNLGVCCLVSDQPVVTEPTMNTSVEEPQLNRLMWSHYAKGMQGICIEFDAQLLNDSLLELNTNHPVTHSVIKYSEHRPVVNMFDFMESFYKRDSSQPTRLAMKLVEPKHTKSSIWAYENELRFHALNAVDKALKYDPKAIRAVYIGQRIDLDGKKLLADTLHKLGVHTLNEVYLQPNSFLLGVRTLQL